MKSKFAAIWRFLASIKYSATAFVAAVVLGLAGMSVSVSGIVLYYATSFAMPPSFQSLDDARGAWVWPALTSGGHVLVSSFSFGGRAEFVFDQARPSFTQEAIDFWSGAVADSFCPVVCCAGRKSAWTALT